MSARKPDLVPVFNIARALAAMKEGRSLGPEKLAVSVEAGGWRAIPIAQSSNAGMTSASCLPASIHSWMAG